MKTGAYRSWVGERQNDIRTMTDGTVFLSAITVKKGLPLDQPIPRIFQKNPIPGVPENTPAKAPESAP